MMRKTLRLAFAFAGGFLGAGFVSGRELWQFFGCFGFGGILGFVAAGTLMAAIGITVMEMTAVTHGQTVDEVAVRGKNRCLSGIISVLQGAFLFGVATIMLAAGAALLHQLWQVRLWIGGAALSLLVIAIGCRGVNGLIVFFSGLVPLIVGGSIVITLAAFLILKPEGTFVTAQGSANPLLPCWWVAALTYTSYNVLGTIGLQISLGSASESRGQRIQAAVIGVLLLAIMAFCVLAALFLDPVFLDCELPMLEIACQISPAAGCVYGLLLLGGMLGSCLTSLIALTASLQHREAVHRVLDKRYLLPFLTMLCFLGSLFGFGTLVGTVYPIFGYAGFFVIGCLADRAMMYKKQEDRL